MVVALPKVLAAAKARKEASARKRAASAKRKKARGAKAPTGPILTAKKFPGGGVIRGKRNVKNADKPNRRRK